MQGSPFDQTAPLQDRIASFAQGIRERASHLPLGKERDDLLRRAGVAGTASRLSDWMNLPLSPRK
jgi:hypothetical protein